jgi:hypothetical protein
MKTSLAPGPRRPLDRQTAWGCLTTNQLVLPGLGSVAAGRKTGYAQAALALLGVVLSGAFAAWFFAAWFHRPHAPADLDELKQFFAGGMSYVKAGGIGLICFLSGWFWALATSINIVRESKAARM